MSKKEYTDSTADLRAQCSDICEKQKRLIRKISEKSAKKREARRYARFGICGFVFSAIACVLTVFLKIYNTSAINGTLFASLLIIFFTLLLFSLARFIKEASRLRKYRKEITAYEREINALEDRL